MGYCVDMELTGVRIGKENEAKAIDILEALNEKWKLTYDWCRFTEHETTLNEIIEEIGFECEEYETHYLISEFNREKLGDHENMFTSLAPILDDCSIEITGEDGTNWKIIIKDHKAKVIY